MFEKQSKKRKQIMLSFEIDENTFNIITEIQSKYDLKRSEVARTLLQQGIDKYLLEDK